MSATPAAPQWTLEWTDLELLDSADRDRLCGVGAPFEMELEEVLGTETLVFRHRPANLREALAAATERHANKSFLVDAGTGEELSYAEVADRVTRIAHHLAEDRNIARGDRVAVASANTVEYVLVLLATSSLGAIAVNLNSWWTPSEMASGIELTDAALVLADQRRLALLHDLPARRNGAWPPLIPISAVVDRGTPCGSELVRPPNVEIVEDDPNVILFTSGTTGRPKGATISHRNLVHLSLAIMLAGAVRAALGLSRTSEDQPCSILVGPLFHLSGIAPLVSGLFAGMKLVVPPAGRWSAEATLEIIERHRVTNLTVVPTQIWQILQHERFETFDTSSLVSIGGGGATCPPELARLLRLKLPHSMGTQGYGMTESTGMGTRLAAGTFQARPETVGTVEATMRLQIRDERGEVLPPGEVGEIHLQGASVFLGYWSNPEATAGALGAGRWYRTGDYGRTDGRFLTLESRMRDLIIRGGENIYPIEIENRLVEHPAVAEAAVVGVHHALLGQEVKAFIVAADGCEPSVEEVRAFVGEVLAPYKVPAHVEFRAAFPYNAAGKVLKRELERADPSMRRAFGQYTEEPIP